MLKKTEKLLLNLGVLAIIILALMITASVVSRAVFNVALPDSIIIVRELMVAAIVLPLASATLARTHVAVEFVSNAMPARARAWLIVLGTVVGLLALMPLIYAGSRELIGTLESGAFYYGDLNLPKWPSRLFFLVGIFVCWIRLWVLLVQDVASIRRGDLHFDETTEQVH